MTVANADEFMKLLSKLLAVRAAEEDETGKTLRELDKLLRDELPEALNQAGHPNAPVLSSECDNFQKALETAVAARKFLDKPIVALEGEVSRHLFSFWAKYTQKNISTLFQNMDVDVPILIVNGEAESTRMEIVNYANTSIAFDLNTEFPLLLEGCDRFQIPLERVATCFVLTQPVKEAKAGSFLLLTEKRESFLQRFAALRFWVAPPKGVFPPPTRIPAKNCEAVLCEKENPGVDVGMKQLSLTDFSERMAGPIPVPRYGFWEEYAGLTGDILNYFSIEMHHSERLIESLTDDVIRSTDVSGGDAAASPGKAGEAVLTSLQEEEKARLENSKDNATKLKEMIFKGEELIRNLEENLDGRTSRFVPQAVLDTAFKTFFDAAEAGNHKLCEQARLHLQTLGYRDSLLMKKYVKSIKSKTDSRGGLESGEAVRLCQNSGQQEWAKAKMLVELLDVENVPKSLLERLAALLEGHVATGKELYVRAMTEPDPKRHEAYLWSSLDEGYAPAGSLLQKYRLSNEQEKMQKLAQHLIPEACLALGDAELERKTFVISLEDPCMCYYKLAASQNSREALARIADVLFEQCFSDVCFIDQESFSSLLKKNAKIICWISDRLIGEDMWVNHFKEISGITLFCLKDETAFFNARRRLLSVKPRSPRANYCLGYMSEYGLGGAKHLTSAVTYYEKALASGPLFVNGRYVSERLSAARTKLRNQFKKRIDRYNEDEDYSGSSETTVSGGGSATMVFLVSLGLSYHAAQLNEIRSFRDAFIGNTPIGKQLVAEYYRIGPMIRRGVEQSGRTREICDWLLHKYVKNIQQEIRKGNREKAIRDLIDMQIELCKKYDIPYNAELVKQYRQQELG